MSHSNRIVVCLFALLLMMPAFAQAAARQQRERGPVALQEALAVYDALAPEDRTPEAKRRLDLIAGQKDAHASRLFWYTDLDAAVAAAKEQGKPVLSLRLLGRLDDDLSCANSRFFRSVLYPDERVNAVLGDKYILHWQSVADVPHITVEFSDGRKLKRTVVGNSIHYILTPDGRVVDALPGLYAPGTFLRELEKAEAVATDRPGRVELVTRFDLQALLAARVHAADATDQERASMDTLMAYHYGWAEVTSGRLTEAMAEVGVPEAAERVAERNAAGANARTRSKELVSAPMLRALGEEKLRQATGDDRLWAILAKDFEQDAKLGDASVALIREKTETAEQANRRTYAKLRVADPILAMVRNLERDIALDTARNEYDLRRRLHRWFADGEVDAADVEGLNRRVYAELFLMPLDDAWLGLSPGDVYTGLDGAGERE